MINQEIEKLIEEFEKLKKKSEYSTGNGTWHISSRIVKIFFRSALRQVAEKTAEYMLVEERGSEEQEKGCGLYHWNDARQEQIKQKEKLLQKHEPKT